MRVRSTAPFRVCEDFVDRFTNIKLAGLNYDYFVPANAKKDPYTKNTRIYSCILIDNSITHRWSGAGKNNSPYNEDTNLSLKVLKDGDCTVLMNTFACGKTPTMTMGGGNTDEIYKKSDTTKFDNRFEFANCLKEEHPDVVEITQRYGRWHHQVDYSSFAKNKFILKEGLDISKDANEYGMVLVRVDSAGIPVNYANIDTIFNMTEE